MARRTATVHPPTIGDLDDESDSAVQVTVTNEVMVIDAEGSAWYSTKLITVTVDPVLHPSPVHDGPSPNPSPQPTTGVDATVTTSANSHVVPSTTMQTTTTSSSRISIFHTIPDDVSTVPDGSYVSFTQPPFCQDWMNPVVWEYCPSGDTDNPRPTEWGWLPSAAPSLHDRNPIHVFFRQVVWPLVERFGEWMRGVSYETPTQVDPCNCECQFDAMLQQIHLATKELDRLLQQIEQQGQRLHAFECGGKNMLEYFRKAKEETQATTTTATNELSS